MAAEMTSEKAAAAKRFEKSVANILGLLIECRLCFLGTIPGDAKYIAGGVPKSKNGGIPSLSGLSKLNGSFINPKG